MIRVFSRIRSQIENITVFVQLLVSDDHLILDSKDCGIWEMYFIRYLRGRLPDKKIGYVILQYFALFRHITPIMTVWLGPVQPPQYASPEVPVPETGNIS